FNAINMLKAIVICALVSGVYTFYSSSTAFKNQLPSIGPDDGRLEAFLMAAKVLEGFWTHLFGFWLHSFMTSFISCALLLLLLASNLPNNWLKKDAHKTRAS
ncbi:MAG: hypothetical protein KJN89_11855, partial [Gammaproteobacteria bacterium]|nr:hypothetical protein [Gammaproteobacteria bacterium]